MNSTRHERAVHSMKAQVPAFHACRCHGRGTSASTKPRKDRTGKSGKVGSSERMMIVVRSMAEGSSKRPSHEDASFITVLPFG